MEFLFPERHVSFFSDEYVLLFLIPCRTTRLDGSTLDVRVNAAKNKKHSAQLPPAPWDTEIIRKNNVIDTYASIDYARERNVGHLRVRRMVPKGDGCTEHHH